MEDNQLIQIPNYIWSDAVALAHIQKASKIKWQGNFENIPAVEYITSWWNSLEGIDLKLRCAGSFEVYIQDEEDPEKWYEMCSWNEFGSEIFTPDYCAQVTRT